MRSTWTNSAWAQSWSDPASTGKIVEIPSCPKIYRRAVCADLSHEGVRSAYDHRLRAQVVRAGTRCLPEHIRIPRATVSTWRRRGQRPIVTIEPLDEDQQQLVDTIAKLEQKIGR